MSPGWMAQAEQLFAEFGWPLLLAAALAGAVLLTSRRGPPKA